MEHTHLFGDTTTEFPSNTRLDGEYDVFSLDFPWPPGVLRVDERVGEHLCDVAVREFEELV